MKYTFLFGVADLFSQPGSWQVGGLQRQTHGCIPRKFAACALVWVFEQQTRNKLVFTEIIVKRDDGLWWLAGFRVWCVIKVGFELMNRSVTSLSNIASSSKKYVDVSLA